MASCFWAASTPTCDPVQISQVCSTTASCWVTRLNYTFWTGPSTGDGPSMSSSMRLSVVCLLPRICCTTDHSDTRTRRATRPHRSMPFPPEVMKGAISLAIVFRLGRPVVQGYCRSSSTSRSPSNGAKSCSDGADEPLVGTIQESLSAGGNPTYGIGPSGTYM